MKRIIHPLNDRFGIIILGLLAIGISCKGQTNETSGKSNSYKKSDYVYPLKSGVEGSHYLTDQTNRPFFWSGDAAWSLIAQLSKQDVDYYLDNRKEKGFSIIMISLIEHKFCTNPPANYYGDLPFTGKIFASPDENYFANADYVLNAAARRNIVVLLAPLYLGYACKDEGWCAEVKAASISDLRSWGRYVGNRYKNFSNIVWLIGGDTDPSQVKDKVLEMVRGIRDFDTLHLFTAHNHPESMAITPWPEESWLSVNNVYSYDSVLYRQYKKAYSQTPVIPFYEIESAYENEHNSTPQQLRSQAYWAILSGAMGHIFGNCPIWHFGGAKTWCNLTDWKAEMNNNGSVSMDYLQRLFKSRPWYLLIPDIEHRVLTSGFGSWGCKDYVTTAITSDSNTMIAYLPSNRMVTVDMSKISGGKAKCWWYNPADGKTISIGTFNNSGFRSFTPNSNGDWVLVIDNASMKWSAPGNQIFISSPTF
jgi:hypothetical protein